MNEVTTYYLEMKSATSLKDKNASKGLQINECEIKQFQFITKRRFPGFIFYIGVIPATSNGLSLNFIYGFENI